VYRLVPNNMEKISDGQAVYYRVISLYLLLNESAEPSNIFFFQFMRGVGVPPLRVPGHGDREGARPTHTRPSKRIGGLSTPLMQLLLITINEG